MAYLLMKTGGASAEEVDGLIAALEDEGVACYLTDSGRWKIGVDGLWLADSADIERAQAIGAEYQKRFSQESREMFRAMQERGEVSGFTGHALRHPIKTIAGVLAIIFILGISLLPFMRGL